MSRSKKMPARPEQLSNYVKKHFGDKKVAYAYEAGPTGYQLYDHLSENGEDCLVVSPLSIPKAPNQKVKNNRIDSLKIAEELKAGKLSSIRVPCGIYRELRHLVGLRENYVNVRMVSKQRIKALLLHTGLLAELKDGNQNWSRTYIHALEELPCSPAVRCKLDMLLSDLEYARKQTMTVLRQLKIFCQDNEELRRYMAYAMSVSGIGFITSVTLLGRVGDPRRLKNVRELSAFAGLVPRENSTGDTVERGSITHLGNRTLRTLLVEAAWSAIRRDTELNQFYYRIRSRHHPKIGSRKAIVAVARKLTHRIYRVWKDQRMYMVR